MIRRDSITILPKTCSKQPRNFKILAKQELQCPDKKEKNVKNKLISRLPK